VRAANPAGTRAITHACHPSAAVSHLAGNPGPATVPPAGPPRHHRRPGNRAGTRKPRKSRQNLFLFLLPIFFPKITPVFILLAKNLFKMFSII
jgi:hypothetical protein